MYATYFNVDVCRTDSQERTIQVEQYILRFYLKPTVASTAPLQLSDIGVGVEHSGVSTFMAGGA